MQPSPRHAHPVSFHLSLGGEVGAQRRARGPLLSYQQEGPLTPSLSPEGRGGAGAATISLKGQTQ
ncbi:hypothetical protein SAMN02983003_3698 [Devosia enhydra]|uniref:Uncharacterized protein n=1 Tax=Devosia enhydra TaxID=665118 RepID=A0A1K2I454_9HYPH|nr:hypothetical protein SAMN02983003_3698 [Devosia enhydra]